MRRHAQDIANSNYKHSQSGPRSKLPTPCTLQAKQKTDFRSGHPSGPSGAKLLNKYENKPRTCPLEKLGIGTL